MYVSAGTSLGLFGSVVLQITFCMGISTRVFSMIPAFIWVVPICSLSFVPVSRQHSVSIDFLNLNSPSAQTHDVHTRVVLVWIHVFEIHLDEMHLHMIFLVEVSNK